MTNKLNVADSSEPVKVPVRRRNTGGRSTTAVSMTLPNELSIMLDALAAKEHRSKSAIVTDLIREALLQRDTRKEK